MFEIAVGGSRGRSRARPGVIAGEAGGDTFQGSDPRRRRGGPRSFFSPRPASLLSRRRIPSARRRRATGTAAAGNPGKISQIWRKGFYVQKFIASRLSALIETFCKTAQKSYSASHSEGAHGRSCSAHVWAHFIFKHFWRFTPVHRRHATPSPHPTTPPTPA